MREYARATIVELCKNPSISILRTILRKYIDVVDECFSREIIIFQKNMQDILQALNTFLEAITLGASFFFA